MAKTSAGVLLYRRKGGVLEVFLVHPGGPFWARKDLGAWSIPKGEYSETEDPLHAARREFEEETGTRLEGDLVPLSDITQTGGKKVKAWAVEGDRDPRLVRSNTFELEWPPRSGRVQSFPEIDQAAWFPMEAAKLKIVKGQLPLLEELERKL